MNKDLEKIIKIYATKNHKKVSTFLEGKSKADIISMLIGLLTIYFNDKNSSTLREYILVSLSDFKLNKEKLGYDGYKQTGAQYVREECEAKPKNLNTGDENWKKKKLNGAGNFTDYTFARFKRDKTKNPLMLVGGFVNGKLIFIFKFYFNSETFTTRMENNLMNRFPKGKDIKGEYLRSSAFSVKDYQNIEDLEVEVYLSKKELQDMKKYMTEPIYEILEKSV